MDATLKSDPDGALSGRSPQTIRRHGGRAWRFVRSETERDRRAFGAQWGGKDYDHQHDPGSTGADFGGHSGGRHRHLDEALAGAGADQFRSGLRAATRQFDRGPESALFWTDLR